METRLIIVAAIFAGLWWMIDRNQTAGYSAGTSSTTTTDGKDKITAPASGTATDTPTTTPTATTTPATSTNSYWDDLAVRVRAAWERKYGTQL